MWCSFDYVLRPDPTVPGIEVQIGDAPDEVTVKWFPDIRRGMEKGRQVLLDHRGRELVGVLITITKIYAHDIATTSWACERYASQFIYGLGRGWYGMESVPVTA